MRTAIRTRRRAWLNTDGRPHPLENTLSVITLSCGVLALIFGAGHDTHLIASIIGVVGLAIGLFSQLISATTGERWLNVVGLGACFVGLALAISHGGFTG
jgi:hypothetical protein